MFRCEPARIKIKSYLCLDVNQLGLRLNLIYVQATFKVPHEKKKIIPVQDELESSPSPESPSSPVADNKAENGWGFRNSR